MVGPCPVFLAAVAFAALGAACAQDPADANAPVGKEDARAVRVALATAGNLPRTVTATGTLAAEDQVVLNTKVSGRLAELPVDLGSTVEAGDVVLVRSDPRDIPRIVNLSKATYRKMIQNLWWAAGYNVIAIPLAAGVLAGRGIVLSPAVGAILMSGSTVVVAINAQLLRRAKL